MARLTFEGPGLALLAASCQQKKVPMLFVHDDGLYVMPKGNGQLAVYAKGYDPKNDPHGTVWDRARDAVGGDDFAEEIVLDLKSLQYLQMQGVKMVITVTAKRLSVSVYSPPLPAKKGA